LVRHSKGDERKTNSPCPSGRTCFRLTKRGEKIGGIVSPISSVHRDLKKGRTAA